MYDGRPGEIVFESNLLGTHPAFLADTLKTHTVVHDKVFNIPSSVEDSIWDDVQQKYSGKGYDFGGALYLGIMERRLKSLGIAKPQVNAWAKPDQYFCDELYIIFNKYPDYFPKIDIYKGMETPHDLWDKVEAA